MRGRWHPAQPGLGGAARRLRRPDRGTAAHARRRAAVGRLAAGRRDPRRDRHRRAGTASRTGAAAQVAGAWKTRRIDGVTYAGVVLAGGRSSRMGTSKAALEWHGSTL